MNIEHIMQNRNQEPINQTSCCTTDSKRTHRCCHLPNNFDSCWILPILHNGPGDSPQPPHASGWDPCLHLIQGSLSSPESITKMESWLSRFSTAYGCAQQADTHNVCSNRRHLCTTYIYAMQPNDLLVELQCGRISIERPIKLLHHSRQPTYLIIQHREHLTVNTHCSQHRWHSRLYPSKASYSI